MIFDMEQDALEITTPNLQLIGNEFPKLSSPRYANLKATYEAGYTTIPKDLKLAILDQISYDYENRGLDGDSGINVTKATWWVYMFSPAAFVVVEVARLKRYLKLNHWEETDKKVFAPNSDNPTKGFLLMDYHIKELLSDSEYD